MMSKNVCGSLTRPSYSFKSPDSGLSVGTSCCSSADAPYHPSSPDINKGLSANGDMKKHQPKSPSSQKADRLLNKLWKMHQMQMHQLGFSCPHCFSKFPTAQALQNHYKAAAHCESSSDNSVEENKTFIPPDLDDFIAINHQLKALEKDKALLQDVFHEQMFKLSTVNSKILAQKEEFKNKVNKLTEDFADMRLSLNDSQAQRLSLESALRLSEEQVKSLKIEIQKRDDLITQLEVKLKSSKEEMKSEKEQFCLKSNRETSVLQTKYSKLERDYDVMCESLKSAIDEKDSLAQQLKDKVMRLTDAISLSKKGIDELEKRLQKSQSAVKDANKGLNNLSEKLKAEKRSHNKQMEHLLQEKQSLEKQVLKFGAGQQELQRKPKELSPAKVVPQNIAVFQNQSTFDSLSLVDLASLYFGLKVPSAQIWEFAEAMCMKLDQIPWNCFLSRDWYELRVLAQLSDGTLSEGHQTIVVRRMCHMVNEQYYSKLQESGISLPVPEAQRK